MRRALKFKLAFFAIGAYFTPWQPAWAACAPATNLGLYTPRFGGDEQLSAALSSVLNLQIWSTLRSSDGKRNFGCGSLYWDPVGTNAVSTDEVRLRLPREADLLFWGRIKKIGSGIIVESTLQRDIDNRRSKSRPEVWRVTLNGRTVEYEPIKLAYSFAPFVVDDAVVAHYSSISNLKVCGRRVTNCSGPQVRQADVRAVRQDGDFAQVRMAGTSGWIYLPQIAEKSEVINFVAGVVRMMRGDYEGAYQSLEAIRSTHAGTSMKVDALIIQSVAAELLGRSGLDKLSEARILNPFVREIFQIKVMHLLAKAASQIEPQQRESTLREAREIATKGSKLFAPDNDWIVSINEILG